MEENVNNTDDYPAKGLVTLKKILQTIFLISAIGISFVILALSNDPYEAEETPIFKVDVLPGVGSEPTFNTFTNIQFELDQKREIKRDELIKAARTVSTPAEYQNLIVKKCAEFGCNANQVIRIMYCESTANPYAQNNIYKGLFQHHEGFWPARAARAGVAGSSIYDAYAQIQVTTQMFAAGQAYLWECQ